MTWISRRQERLVYLLAAVALAVTLGAGLVGGFRLHHAANVERQALRTEELSRAVFELQGYSLRIQVLGPSQSLATGRRQALANVRDLFEGVRRHGNVEAARLQPSFDAYVAASTSAFKRASNREVLPPPVMHGIDLAFGNFQSQVGVESRILAEEIRVTNPSARFALVFAAIAAALLVALLIWQFELQRRAGRIDRDNAARTEELSRLREEFVAAVSHELRTPLTSIIGYLDLIVDGETENLDEEQLAHLAVAQRNAQRLHGLVGDLLLVAEVEDGTVPLDIREADIDALATDCIESARPLADDRQIQLTLERGAGRTIEGDPIRLGQMMDNLVSNALKFTPAHGRVRVRTAFDDGYAIFEVTDTGPGISRADQEQLFERFFRARTAIDKAIRGTGLGLAITKAIVDAHHGTITVQSTVGMHSTFCVRLPETQPDDVEL